MTGADSVYRERARLVAHLAAVYPSTIGHYDAQWPEYQVVIIELPAGQVSWHIAPSDFDLFTHVRMASVNTWDGHSTEEKYARLAAHTRALAQKEN